MLFNHIVTTSANVAATSSRLDKTARLAELFRTLSTNEIAIVIGFLTGWPRQGKLGVGWASISSAQSHAAASESSLTIHDVDDTFERLAAAKGKNANTTRVQLVRELFTRATVDEQQFLSALIVGEVRQGALESVLLDGIAKAATVPADRLRRAVMLAGDLGLVARKLLTEGESALADLQLQLFRPVQPMLADSAATVDEAITDTGGEASVEWKLDGARVQAHRDGDRIAIYTRNLNDVTARLPEIVAAIGALPAQRLILDGEVIALRRDGKPHAFQTTMKRFGKRLHDEALHAELPLTPFFFDVLLHDDETLIDEPLRVRLDHLDRIMPASMQPTRIVTASADVAAQFQSDALEKGHEGVMVKSLDAPYAAGRRGSAWIKVKKPRSVDLVVLAAEWGSGRRRGWLSNLHLGARDPATGEFIMLGKTFKGMTDELLVWQTTELLARESRREGHVVFVRPELVIEIAFNEVQESSQYPGGVTLRFARVKGYRPDKNPSEADTIEAVRAFLP